MGGLPLVQLIERLNFSDPNGAMEANWYVPPPGHDHVAAQIIDRCRTSVAPRLLFLGGMGTGKSTALLAAQRALNGAERLAHCVSSDRLFDAGGARPGALIALVGMAMLHGLRRHQGTLNGTQRTAALVFHGALKRRCGGSELIDRSMLGAVAPAGPDELLERLGDVLHAWGEARSRGAPQTTLLVDALDRRSWEEFEEGPLRDVELLRDIDVGLVIAGSVSWRKHIDRELEARFSHLWLSPPYDTSDDEVCAFLRRVLAVRDEGSFSDEIRDVFVRRSGGVIRELLRLADAAVRIAIADRAEVVEPRHTERAVAVARDGTRSLLPPTLRACFEAWRRGEATLTDDMAEDLRARGCVVEVDGRWALHPLFDDERPKGEAA